MAEQLVLIESTGAVRKLTLNRPAALNSFTSAMHRELRAALDAAADDAGVRCLVITGAGRGFCAGQDLNDPEVGTTSARWSSASTSRWRCASRRCRFR